jgi:NTP pyrophosphatase (non-canonical NTP hydrolase)
MDDTAWDVASELAAWLDESSPLPPESEKLIRLMKLSEEVGEVTAAVIGVLGQNPRKGVTHTWDDVNAELCDVILAAMVALATIAPDARSTFAQRLDHVCARSLHRRPGA